MSLRDALSDEQRLELVEYWRSVTKRKWAILFLALVIAVVAGAVAYSLPPIYRSTTTLLIEADKSKVVKIDEVYGGISQAREHYQTQIELLKSRELALRTIERLKLWEVPEFDPRKAKDKLQAQLVSRAKLAIGLTEPEIEWTDERLLRGVLGAFTNNLSVEPVRLSQLVKVSFESENAELSAKVAQTLADIYISSDRDARFKVTQEASAWLQERVGSLRAKLDASERALQGFRDKQGLVNIGGSAQAMDTQQISNLTTRLVEARVKRAENESIYEDLTKLRAAGKAADYGSVAAVMRHPSVVDAKKVEATAQQKLSELSQRYGFEHPRIVQATAELQSAKAQPAVAGRGRGIEPGA